jgi:hypothetical protein
MVGTGSMGASRVIGAPGFTGRVFVGRVPPGFIARPNVRTQFPFPGHFHHPFFNNPFSFSDAFARAQLFFGHNSPFDRRDFFFGTGFSPFFNNWGWGGGWYAGGWPYAVDYGVSNYDQAELYQSQVAQDARLQTEMQDDERRQMELEQELADQRAADAASRAAQRAPQSTSTPTERELPPTVLVYRDHHEVELRNYAIAGNTIFDLGPHWTRKISISDLDIPATISANEERGIQFKLPNSTTSTKQ